MKWTARVLEEKDYIAPALRYKAAALTHLGRTAEANAAAERLLTVNPAFSLSRLKIFTFRHQWMSDLMMEGLRRAGLPE